MPQANRKYIEDVTVWTADGSSYLDRLQGAEIVDEIDTKENSALLDAVEYPKKTKRRIRVEFDEAVEGAAALTPGETYNVVANDGAQTYSGPALLLSRRSKIAGEISRNFAFQFQGLPTIT
jgi:hypothetical protein